MRRLVLWIFLVLMFLLAFVGTHAQTVKATATAHSVSISWTASTTPGVTYTIYKGTAASGPFGGTIGITTTTYTDTAVTPGASYFYQVTAVCTAACPAGITGESLPSNQIEATIPNPQPPASPTNLHLGSVTVVIIAP
jgi:fibronectin type 3 domain-containing protein